MFASLLKKLFYNPKKKIFLDLEWKFLSPQEVFNLRKGNTEIFLKYILFTQLQKLNLNFMDTRLVEKLYREIHHLHSNIEGNRTF